MRLFRRVTIIGVGLIGGSLGKALKQRRIADRVIGFSRRQSTLDAALKCGAVDEGTRDLKRAVAGSDLVILATPIETIKEMFALIAPHLKRNGLVTDVGSVKTAVVRAAEDGLKQPAFFVGTHPLAGSEKGGVQHADGRLFENAVCVLTPTERTHRQAQERIRRLWTLLGSRIKVLSPEEHDEILAYTSHLPHLLAFALMETIPEKTMEYAAQGFKDVTRIASSAPALWTEICLNNTRPLQAALDEAVRRLGGMRRALAAREARPLMEAFRQAKARRDALRE